MQQQNPKIWPQNAIPPRVGAPLEWAGMRVILSALLEEDGPPEVVRRSWRERLLGWPWRPWVATVSVVPRVPCAGAVQLNGRTLVIHPETWRALKAGDDVKCQFWPEDATRPAARATRA